MLGRIAGIFMAWLALATVFAAILVPLDIPKILHIKSNEATAIGVITGKNCNDHAMVYYSFHFDNRNYQGYGNRGVICSSAKSGQTITIYYDSRDPNLNISWEPQRALWNEIIPISLVCLKFPPLLIWLFTRALSRRHQYSNGKKTGLT